MVSIRSIATALPKYNYTADQVKEVVKIWLKNQPERFELLERFISSSNTKNRHFALPAEDIIALGGLAERTQIFEDLGPKLGVAAIEKCFAESDVVPSNISSFVFTSCSCPVIPSIDALILEKIGLARNVKRIPIFQHGCAGGVTGLSIASQLLDSHQAVLLSSVELCSLVFQKESKSAAQLVGASIFADGAAAVILDQSSQGLVVKKTESYLIPNSRHLMGYDNYDDGFHLRLDKNLPGVLANIAPERVSEFLDEQKLKISDINYWLFHPGGIKILDSLEKNLDIKPENACWAREVLTSIGNLSSASVLFVLERFIQAKVLRNGDRVIMLGVGPGLTIEIILFEYVL